MGTGAVSFGHITFDMELGLLSRDGLPLTISHRAIALLRSLVEHQGQPVSKAALSEAAWPDQIVEEGNLTVQIAALRKALGPMPDGNDWIVTVPRVGYRLLRQVAPPQVQADTIILPSLAVLPFANLSGDPEQDYFADGVVEDIITALSCFKSFAVIARNSSFAYKGKAVDVRQVAKELGVRYVLEGSVRRAGSKLRINAKLVDGTNGASLWAQNFDGAASEIFDMQDRITESVVGLVEPKIQKAEIERSRRERPGSIAVYDLYIRALPKVLLVSEQGNAEAYTLLTQALELEPDNALLLSLAAETLSQRGVMGWLPIGPNDREDCTAFALRALQGAAGDATVLAFCTMALSHMAKEYDLAMATIQSAASTNPNNMIVAMAAGVAHIHCGSVEDALKFFERALRLSPVDLHTHGILTGIAHCHMIRGEYREALTWAARSRVHAPNYTCNLWILAAANARLGNMAEAGHHLESLAGVSPGVTIAMIRAGQPAKDPSRIAAILEGLRMAGLPEA